jgi:hypothetical protein
MALPSGTTISAANINTELGRSSGTAVDWNTTVRNLCSGDTAAPNLNQVRGVRPRSLHHTTGQTTDLYTNNTFNVHSTSAFNIPGTGYRLVAVTNVSPAGAAVIELKIFSQDFGLNYVYRLSGVSPLATHPASVTTYVTPMANFAMLANGKFVIVYALHNNIGSYGGSYGLCITVLTFNTNGSIATTNNYLTKMGNVFSSPYGNNSYQLGNNREDRMMSASGNTCSFTVGTNWGDPSIPSRYVVAKLDCTSSSPTLQYTLVSSNDQGYANGVYSDDGANVGGGIKSVMLSDGSQAIIRRPRGNASSIDDQNVMMVKLNSAGTAYVNPGFRWGASSASGYGVHYVYPGILPGTGSSNLGLLGNENNILVDNSIEHNVKNYFIARSYFSNPQILQVQGSPYNFKYFTGCLSGVLIQKINADTNNIKYTIGISSEAPYAYTSSSSKSGTVYNYYSYQSVSSKSLLAVRTDSSDNTYYLFRVHNVGVGGNYNTNLSENSFGGAINPLPGTNITLYYLYKISSTGTVLWFTQFDIGPGSENKSAFANPSSSFNSEELGVARATWSILIKEEISTVEVYANYGVRDSGIAHPFTFRTDSYVVRTAQVSSITGNETYVNSILAGDKALGMNTRRGTAGPFNYYNYSGGNENAKYFAPQVYTRTNYTSSGNTSNYTSLSTWTDTLSANSTTQGFVLSPTTLTTGITESLYTSF